MTALVSSPRTAHPVPRSEPHPAALGSAIPDSYMLTTTWLRHHYPDDASRCHPAPHRHAEHVVLWPEDGSGWVEVDGSHVALNLGQGLWVPAGVTHTTPGGDTELCATHIDIGAWHGPTHLRTVSINTAVRELLIHLAWTSMPRQQRLRAQRVCLELIDDDITPAVDLPIPRDPRIGDIARAILADPGDPRSIEDWAWRVSVSTRTIARAFRADTGLTFSQWRTNARMAAAVELLGSGVPVGVVSRRVGYTTISAFSAAFHRVVGSPPHRFLHSAFGEP